MEQIDFRKAIHREQMPLRVKYILRRHSVDTNLQGKNIRHAQADSINFSGWFLFTSVKFDEVLALLKSVWPSARRADAELTIEMLVNEKFLRKMQEEVYIIDYPQQEPASKTPTPPPYQTITTRGNKQRYKERRRAGICPRCLRPAKNKNRHANSAHRAEECLENICANIIES